MAGGRLGWSGIRRFRTEDRTGRRAIFVLGTYLIAVSGLPAGPGEEEPTFYISLKPKTNHKLKEGFHPGAR
jgi:hypothetical protein